MGGREGGRRGCDKPARGGDRAGAPATPKQHGAPHLHSTNGMAPPTRRRLVVLLADADCAGRGCTIDGRENQHHPCSSPSPLFLEPFNLLPICRSPSSREAFGPLQPIMIEDGRAAQRPSEANPRLAPAGHVGAPLGWRFCQACRSQTGTPPDRLSQECLGAYKM